MSSKTQLNSRFLWCTIFSWVSDSCFIFIFSSASSASAFFVIAMHIRFYTKFVVYLTMCYIQVNSMSISLALLYCSNHWNANSVSLTIANCFLPFSPKAKSHADNPIDKVSWKFMHRFYLFVVVFSLLSLTHTHTHFLSVCLVSWFSVTRAFIWLYCAIG